MTPKILIVDDEQDILDLLTYNLRKDGCDVIVAHDGREALGLASLQPDLILLDIMMPEMDGWEVCRRLRGREDTRRIPIIMLTARAGEVDEILGLELGADDYIQKPISPRLLLARIRALIRRNADAPEEALRRSSVEEIGLVVDRDHYSVSLGGEELPFPKKEFELLSFLVMNRGKLYSRQNLLDQIWGHDVYVTDRTVDVHVRKLRQKLGPHADYIETVKGVGYRFRGA